MSDWSVPCSDGEEAGDGFYEPSDPEVIINLYEALQRDEIPKFETTIYPRQEPEKKQTEKKQELKIREKTPEKERPEPTEFDFDTQPDSNAKRFTPRRTPNRPQGKKVAKMENVFSNIMKYKKLEEEQAMEKEGQPTAEPQAN